MARPRITAGSLPGNIANCFAIHNGQTTNKRIDVDETKRCKAIIEDILGLEIAHKDELAISAPQVANFTKKYGAAAYLPNGDLAVFSSEPSIGQMTKMKNLGKQHIENIICGEAPKDYGQPKLPSHIADMFRLWNIEPDIISTLAWILGGIRITVAGYPFQADLCYEPNPDRKLGHHPRFVLQTDETYWSQMKLTLQGKPVVRVTAKGVTIGGDLPVTVKETLVGQKLSAIAEIPFLSDKVITQVTRNKKSLSLRLKGL